MVVEVSGGEEKEGGALHWPNLGGQGWRPWRPTEEKRGSGSEWMGLGGVRGSREAAVQVERAQGFLNSRGEGLSRWWPPRMHGRSRGRMGTQESLAVGDERGTREVHGAEDANGHEMEEAEAQTEPNDHYCPMGVRQQASRSELHEGRGV